MQLGKLSASQSTQELSCKTSNKPAQAGQYLTPEKQNSKPHREEPRSSAELQDYAAGTLDDRSFAHHAGELDPAAVGLLAELPDRIEAPGLLSRSPPTFGAPEKVP